MLYEMGMATQRDNKCISWTTHESLELSPCFSRHEFLRTRKGLSNSSRYSSHGIYYGLLV